MLTFRRNVSNSVLNLWWELCGLIDDLSLSEEDDQILWNYTSNGTIEG